MSGVASPWGMSNEMTAGLRPSLDFGNTHLTGELGLTSIPPTFNNTDQLISPLNVQQQSYFSAFGKMNKRNKIKKSSKKTLKSICKDITYLKK